jgi:hypothetical protein
METSGVCFAGASAVAPVMGSLPGSVDAIGSKERKGGMP